MIYDSLQFIPFQYSSTIATTRTANSIPLYSLDNQMTESHAPTITHSRNRSQLYNNNYTSSPSASHKSINTSIIWGSGTFLEKRGGLRETFTLPPPPPLQRGSKRTSMIPSTSTGMACRRLSSSCFSSFAAMSLGFRHHVSLAANHLFSPVSVIIPCRNQIIRCRNDPREKKDVRIGDIIIK